MRKYSWVVLILMVFSMGINVLADEVQEKTDGSFVGDNNKFSGEDLGKKTDHVFVGENTINSQAPYFAGESYTQQVGNSTDTPFAEDNSKKAKDGVFIGEDLQKKTDGAFTGNDYGK